MVQFDFTFSLLNHSGKMNRGLSVLQAVFALDPNSLEKPSDSLFWQDCFLVAWCLEIVINLVAMVIICLLV